MVICFYQKIIRCLINNRINTIFKKEERTNLDISMAAAYADILNDIEEIKTKHLDALAEEFGTKK